MEIISVKDIRFTVHLLFYFASSRICFAQAEAAQPSTTTKPPSPPPVFLSHPEDTYLVKGQDSAISCAAKPATRIHLKCGEEFVPPSYSTQSQTLDEYSLDHVIRTSIAINKRILNVGDDGVQCHCVAWNDDSERVNSNPATVKIAELDRYFVHTPLGHRYMVSEPIELNCSPPNGDPRPITYWEKDGVRVEEDLHHFISSEGSLVINQAELTDTGNYTCVAENIVTERRSNSAEVVVYENGVWGDWGSWSTCDPLCGEGEQTRRRRCSNPDPEIWEEDCEGPSRETRTCYTDCPVNGGFSDWSDWTACSEECQSFRTRHCDSPRPANGGRDCRGVDQERRNCTDGLCIAPYVHANGDMYGNPKYGVPGPPGIAELVPVYIGIGLAFFVVVMSCIFMVICFMSRRKRDGPLYQAQTTTVDECSMAMLTTMQPDITQTNHPALCTHVHLPSECDKPNGFHHSTSYLDGSKQGSPHNMSVSFSPKNGTITHLGGYSGSSHSDGSHYSAQNGSIKSNPVHTYVPLVGPGSTERHYCSAGKDRPCCYDRCHGPDDDPSNFYCQQHRGDEPVYALPIQSSESSMGGPESEADLDLPPLETGPARADMPMMASGRFGPRGGRLIIPEAGVSLYIPDGAITRASGEDVYLAVNPDPTNLPNISPHCTSLSPMVVSGPPGVTFSKPVILTLPHCSQRRDGDWRYSIYSSNMATQQEGIWERLVTAGEETINSPVYVQVDQASCSVILDQLGSFVLMGESAPPRTAGKRLRLATFGPALRFNMDYTVKVYVTDDTPDAIEHVVQLEQKFGGALLHRPKLMEFQDGSGNLRLSLEEVMQGWQCKPSANFQEIPFFHVWSGTSNTLHCSFTMAREDPSLDVVGCRIHLTQGQAQMSLQVLDITRRMEDGIEHQNYHASTGQTNTASFETPTKVFRLPRPVRARLCTTLDPPRQAGNDWRLLAAKLGVDGYINYFATKPSPTDQILDLWEARCREDSAVATLIHLLREMGRNDAVSILEQVPWM